MCYVFCYPGNFRIKSKADAAKFLTISKGVFTWSDEENDYEMENGKVAWRPISMRGNIFNPYLDDGKDYDKLIWKCRKYINRKLRGEDE